MKISIELSEAEVKGIKAYLREVGDVQRPTKQDVQQECNGILKGYFQAQHSSLTDYIQKFEK